MALNLLFSLTDNLVKNKRDNRTIAAVLGLAMGQLLIGAYWPTGAIAQTTPTLNISDIRTTENSTSISEEIPEEIPEEILRTEIITEARSPLTGESMTAADYAQLQAELSDPTTDGVISEDLRYLIFLLQLRRSIQPIIPFF